MNQLIKNQIERSLLQFDDEIEFNKSKSDSVRKNLAGNLEYIKWVDDNFVDLGLPSGTLWMNYNLGATCSSTKESWYGDYYAWGELKTKEKYTDENYTYNGDPSILLLSNDVVYQIYSKEFPNQEKIPTMPTHEQIEELIENTNCEWVANYNGIDGLNGGIFTSKVNDTVLFIPAAGYHHTARLYNGGNYCDLWSSSLCSSSPSYAWYLYFDSGNISSSYASNRCHGYSVRGVL